MSQSVILKPLGDLILVVPIAPPGETPGGIVLPEAANQDAPQRGQVMEVGPGRWERGERIPVDVKQGDIVVFNAYDGAEVRYGGVSYRLLPPKAVYAIEKTVENSDG